MACISAVDKGPTICTNAAADENTEKDLSVLSSATAAMDWIREHAKQR